MADFPTEWVPFHSSVKGIFALYEVLRLQVEAVPDFFCSSTITITMDVDNKIKFCAVQNDKVPNELMHNLALPYAFLKGSEGMVA